MWLYDSDTKSMKTLLRREYGLGVQQVEAITMAEARNAGRFGDAESFWGVAMCAAFSMGCLMGGRRPRSLTAIRLEDLQITVVPVRIAGSVVNAPKLEVRFREEMFDDLQGMRRSTDDPSFSDYPDVMYSSPAFWVYRYLAMRGVYETEDPIVNATPGDVLRPRPECMEYYLFCEVQGSTWIDTMPVSVFMLGGWTQTLLARTGSRPRRFSAHRSGFVSRACILAMLDSQGKEIPMGTIESIVRAGGWQAVTGSRTCLRIYARNTIDTFLDNYSISLGLE